MGRRYSISVFPAISTIVAMVFTLFPPTSVKAASDAFTPGATQAVATLRDKLRQPLTPKERESLLQPRKLSSIGEMTRIDGNSPLPCLGVGLVTGLGANGAEKPATLSAVKSEVIKALVSEEQRTITESHSLIESRDSSLVYLTGQIPAGAAAQTTFDVTVEPLDNAISLQGGYLHVSPLYKYIEESGKKTRGGIVARASGQVMAGAVQETVISTAASQRTSVVFDGGVYLEERDFIIFVDPRYKSPQIALLVEYLLNSRFQDVGREPGAAATNYATAVTDQDLILRVPPLYRGNVARFADVVGTIKGSYFYGPPSASEMAKLAKRLETGTPKEKYQASVMLEGVGAPAAPYLQGELAKGDDWTKLYAATALAYLNDARAADTIIKLSNSDFEEVRFRSVGLMALMSGHMAADALRGRMKDSSRRIALEAIKGLLRQGSDSAQMVRFAGFDLVAVSGGEPGLVVVSSGRPMVVMAGPATPLSGSVEAHTDVLGLGSIDSKTVGIVTGEGPNAETVTVDATVDAVLTAVARTNPTFETVKRVLVSMETNKNLPYKIAWLN